MCGIQNGIRTLWKSSKQAARAAKKAARLARKAKREERQRLRAESRKPVVVGEESRQLEADGFREMANVSSETVEKIRKSRLNLK